MSTFNRVIRAFCVALFVMLAFGQAPSAQVQEAVEVATTQITPQEYDIWNNVAERADNLLEEGTVTNETLDLLRSDLAEWRERFLAAQGTNRQRIDSLREQQAALGPAPAEGETEPDEIAARRVALADQLANALVPVRSAEEAYARANGLISRLDSLVRERQAQQTLRLDPTPLNPVLWPKALNALVMVGEAATGEIANNYASASRRSSLRSELPLTLLLLAVGFVLVFRSGAWIERALQVVRARRTDGKAGFRVGTFLASIFAVILPVLGILALISAIEATELTAAVGDQILAVLAMLVTTLAAARWLSNQVFPKAYPPNPVLALEAQGLAEGRFYALMLALLLAVRGAVEMLSDNAFLTNVMTLEVQAVLKFPFIAVAGLMLFRIGQIMIKSVRPTPPEQGEPDDEPQHYRPNLLAKSLGRTAQFVGIAGPVAAAIGYVSLGSMVVFSSVLTLALFALLAVLQRFVRDVYAMLTRDEDKVNALVPVLIGFALAVCALPVLALIWGARFADISETWAVVSAGVQVGESRISPSNFLTFAVIFGLGYMLTRLLQNSLKTQVLPKTKMDIGGRNAVVSGVGYIGIFLAALFAITTAGIDLSGLAIVAGALSVGIGFGLQTVVSNFVSGIILLVERPISEGDWIEVGGTMGVVRDISVRATRVETFDRRDVIVPNADLISTSVTNWTKGNLTGRVIVPVGVAYGTDTRKVEAVLREIAEAHPQVIVRPPPSVFMVGFGADSLDFEIRAILRDVNYVMSAASDMRHEIAKRFAEEGIEIPFAQRDLWLRNPESLRGGEPVQMPVPGAADDLPDTA